MTSFTLEEIRAVVNGRLLVGNPKITIRIAAGKYRRSMILGGVAFLNKHINDEDKLIFSFNQSNVACALIPYSTQLKQVKWAEAGIAVIQVKNLRLAFLDLAGAFRRKFNIPFVQVVGSAGKTTTKEMIGAVLSEGLNPLVGYKNWNLPELIAHSCFHLNIKHQSAVFETGMLQPGDIRTSSRLIRPDIAVVTCLQRAHMVRLGSMAKIISVKAEMLQYLKENGTLIINGEDSNCSKLPLSKYRGKVLTYGFSAEHDLWASDIERDGFKTNFRANGKNVSMQCVINTIGHYNVGNALAAIMVGKEVGLSDNAITQGLAKFQPVEGRLKIHKGINNTIIINDNFNANPDSTSLLLKELCMLAAEYQVVLVLGDMERPSESIRDYAKRVHYTTGQQLAGIDFKYVIAIGKWAKEYENGALSAGFPTGKIEHFPTVNQAEPSFRKLLRPGVVVVLKASRYSPISKLMKNTVCTT
ncbi:MAG: UDP-N-acetylmuramoyl-tripeptide--D-alanyl-D-alanine ligase [Acidobacteriota bacterium]